MSTQWSWCSGEWDTLPETLEELERKGWNILSVCEIGDMQRYVKIVYWRATPEKEG